MKSISGGLAIRSGVAGAATKDGDILWFHVLYTNKVGFPSFVCWFMNFIKYIYIIKSNYIYHKAAINH